MVFSGNQKGDVFELESVVMANWQLVERKRVLSWEIIYQTPRWKEWQLDARENDHLTGPEEEKLIQDARALVMKHLDSRFGQASSGSSYEPYWNAPARGNMRRKKEKPQRDVLCSRPEGSQLPLFRTRESYGGARPGSVGRMAEAGDTPGHDRMVEEARRGDGPQ